MSPDFNDKKCVKDVIPYEFEAIAMNGEKYIHKVFECNCINCDETAIERFDGEFL